MSAAALCTTDPRYSPARSIGVVARLPADVSPRRWTASVRPADRRPGQGPFGTQLEQSSVSKPQAIASPSASGRAVIRPSFGRHERLMTSMTCDSCAVDRSHHPFTEGPDLTASPPEGSVDGSVAGPVPHVRPAFAGARRGTAPHRVASDQSPEPRIHHVGVQDIDSGGRTPIQRTPSRADHPLHVFTESVICVNWCRFVIALQITHGKR